MPRPSQNTDRRLILAAMEMLPVTGFSGLKLRQVAERAGVNLGMFSYHFRNKQAFVRKVMQEFYEGFYSRLSLEAGRGEDPLVQLRQALLAVVRFVREQRQMLLGIARDILEGYQPTLRFLEQNMHRHIQLLVGLVRRCQKDGGLIDLPPEVLMPFLIGSLAAPNFIAALAERTRMRPGYEARKRRLISAILTDQALVQRLEMVFAVLTAHPDRGKAGNFKDARRPKNERSRKIIMSRPIRGQAGRGK